MTATLRAELDVQQTKARSAYIRFMTASDLLDHRKLSAGEASKAENIQLEAFGALTSSLARAFEICDVLYPVDVQEPERQRAPRYSCDLRRNNL